VISAQIFAAFLMEDARDDMDSEALYQELAATTGALCYEDFIREGFGARHAFTVAEAKVNVEDLLPARFLPATLDGKLMQPLPLPRYRGKGNHVDNTQLQSNGFGIEYRLRKDVNDRLPKARGAAWGTVIEGTSDGDGCIRVAMEKTQYYSSVLSECSTACCARMANKCDEHH
jgi:hypothetical protein